MREFARREKVQVEMARDRDALANGILGDGDVDMAECEKIAARAHLTACEACSAAAEKDVQLNSSAEPPEKAAQTETQKSVFRGDDSRWAVPLFGVGDLRKKLKYSTETEKLVRRF